MNYNEERNGLKWDLGPPMENKLGNNLKWKEGLNGDLGPPQNEERIDKNPKWKKWKID